MEADRTIRRYIYKAEVKADLSKQQSLSRLSNQPKPESDFANLAILEYGLAAPKKPEATDFDVSSSATIERS